MIDDVISLLICPHCSGDLRRNGPSLVCSAGHTANIARQGYVSLLGRDSGTHTADSAAMIAARDRILSAGLFDPVGDAVARAVARADEDSVEGAILDLGTGTGHHLARALGAAPGRTGLGVDNSKFAARRAARCHDRAGAIVADIWDRIPVHDGSAAVLINIFSPRNGEEISRLLAPGGRLVVVTPGPDHLRELIEPFAMISVDPDKDERLERSLGVDLELESSPVEWKMNLSRKQVRDLIEMGPSAGRIEAGPLEQLLTGLEEPTEVTGSVRIGTATR